MSMSPLDPASALGRPDRDIARGHGSEALGPSDSSDSGSDLIGAPGDRLGPGQRPAAGNEPLPADGADIATDHIEMMRDAIAAKTAAGKDDASSEEDAGTSQDEMSDAGTSDNSER